MKQINSVRALAPAGKFLGFTHREITGWFGIKYAEAPTGDRRWRPPVLARDGSEEIVAGDFGPACIQPIAGPNVNPIFREEFCQQSEDCLSLNIWAKPGCQDAPVLVWFHGGALLYGSGRSPLFDGSRLASRGLVVVTVNYRLGVLGFLSHPELSAESPDDVSGNYGFLDQVAALKWVRRNIAAFGGDPGKVTIAGESAGAHSVTHLMAAPSARGLFAQAIAQSPYMISVPALRETRHGHPSAEAAGRRLQLACGAASLADMRAMSARDLVRAAVTDGFLSEAVVDGHFLIEQTVDTFARGKQAKVPLLVGSNEGEIRSLRRLLPPAPKTAAEYETLIRARYVDAERFLRLYPSDRIDDSMLAATRDALYGWTAQRMAMDQAAIGVPAYLYRFDRSYPALAEAGLHACHASEIPYVFGSLSGTPPHWPTMPETERRYSDAMLDYWASFVRTGKPTAGPGAWPDFADAQAYMHFGHEPIVAHDPMGERFAFCDEAVKRRRSAGDRQWNWNVGIAAPEGGG